ncbi:hypothetical protein KIPB_011170, partial [Kipferlia bialata]|eukprot:g11170.t1
MARSLKRTPTSGIVSPQRKCIVVIPLLFTLAPALMICTCLARYCPTRYLESLE